MDRPRKASSHSETEWSLDKSLPVRNRNRNSSLFCTQMGVERRVRDSCGKCVSRETPQLKDEEAHGTPAESEHSQ
ncbi:hypothetical protein [Peribacillus simplex]|uniref:hypothetical protein n=1 Tax=Peribacillus simplex TaxID=1478 RepID=UPI001C881D70|nr:hypothetical protein [Peribacillus simplex]